LFCCARNDAGGMTRVLKPAQQTGYGGYAGFFADPDGSVWEAGVAPRIEVGDDKRMHLPD